MSNIFVRTTIAPYRIDIYNALHERLNMTMCFYNRIGKAQRFDMDMLESLCSFKPKYLSGITLGSHNRKICLGLWKMLRKEKPEIVIVPEFQISAMQVLIYRWLTRSKFKVVSMTDDSYDMITNNNDFTKLHAFLRNNIAKYIDDFIVVTPQVEQWYKKRYGKGIWMPIILDEKKTLRYYESLLPKSREVVQRFGLEGKKILLFVGRLVALKNLTRVIEAYNKTLCEATLVIVGDGPERSLLENRARMLKKEIIFTGRFDGDDLYLWYNLASCLILASYQEAFGAVTNEALLSGCRVVVSERAGSSCLVDDTNGELIDPMNEDGIASAIDRQMALAKVPDLITPRCNLMPVSFEERISNLVFKIKEKVK